MIAIFAHVTSFDMPTVAVAFLAGLSAGLSLAWAFSAGATVDKG